MADINDDVEVHFWIGKNDTSITSGHDTIYIGSFEEKTKTTRLFLPNDVTSGSYTFSVQLVYGNYQAKSHRTVELDVREGVAHISGAPVKSRNIYLISFIIGLVTFILALVFYVERKKIKDGLVTEGRWISRHKVSFLVLLLLILGVLGYFLNWFKYLLYKFPQVISWSKAYILPYASFLISVVVGLFILLFVLQMDKRKKGRLLKSKKVKKEVKSFSFIVKNKTWVIVSLFAALILGLFSYLFFTGTLTSEFFLMLLRNAWAWIKYFVSFVNYYIIALISGLIVLVIFLVLAKKKHWFKK